MDAQRKPRVGMLASAWLLAVLVGACAMPGPVGNDHAATAECWACHGDRYEAVKAPDHVGLGYPRQCSACHDTSSWDAAVPDAHRETGSFPLLGRHLGTACSACHGTGDWGPLDPACVACHRDDYDGTTAPAHLASGFPTTCADCHHGFEAWVPATAGPHGPTDGFPLTGGHAGPTCKDCHGNASFADVPRTCDGCHSGDYDGSTNPGHSRLALPRTCQTCHTIQSWTGAVLGAYHRFPITGGKHAGAACATCHAAGQPWGTFTCLTCHEHSRTEMDNQHLGEVPGYTYDTAACYRCHPQGIAGD